METLECKGVTYPGLTRPRPAGPRGKPHLARGAEAREILERFARLYEPAGARIEIDGDRAVVDLVSE